MRLGELLHYHFRLVVLFLDSLLALAVEEREITLQLLILGMQRGERRASELVPPQIELRDLELGELELALLHLLTYINESVCVDVADSSLFLASFTAPVTGPLSAEYE